MRDTIHDNTIIIRTGCKEEAADIARLIILAMTEECCLYFCGPGHDIEDFHRLMTTLVMREDSQYSYRNALCAIDTTTDTLVGISVSYDGGKLHQLRLTFIDAVRQAWGRDFSDMPDETEAGELYLDSLAVAPDHQRRGIARRLIAATADKAHGMNMKLGLLVDNGNPSAEALYHKVGFRQVGTNSWGGHPMKHLQM